jgi:hypothetical protein
MRVSVVVPLYNKVSHVTRCLNSIACQTFTDFEVIIVDDGSTDGSAEILKNFEDRRFRLISQPNAGPGAARNRGVADAQGEMLAFLDADDEWLPEYLEHNLRVFDNSGPEVAAVSSGYIEHPAGVNPERMWRKRGVREGTFTVSPATPPMVLVHTLAYMSCWNTMVRSSIFRSFGGFYSKTRALYAEDAWLWLQVLLNHPVRICFEPHTRFHKEASELSGNLPGVRPVEPFLLEPEPVRATCPSALKPLLRQVLAIRAMKTTCVLGYWGNWPQANQLRSQFSRVTDFRLPYFTPALVCSTPLGGYLGHAWRWLHTR